jgi:hypothetical protein
MIARGFLKAALAFFAVGVVLFVTATIQHNKIGEPDKLAVSDAQAKLDLLDERIVTVSGRIDQDRKLYNIVAYSSELLKLCRRTDIGRASGVDLRDLTPWHWKRHPECYQPAHFCATACA